MKKILVIAVICIFAGIAQATIWYVHPDSTIAFIQEGLDSCAAGDTVMAGAGVYYENIIWPNVQSIYLMSEQGSNNTIVNGMLFDYGFHIATNIDTSTHLRGFTILDGYGHTGGGIYCDSASPTIEYCQFNNNEASGNVGGGAIACVNHASPIISHCNVDNNTSTSYPGGGILVYAYSSPMIHACNLINNTGDPGAGISVAYGCFPIIDSCTIDNNYGDGIYFGGGDGQVHYSNITNNAGYGIRNGDPNFDIEAQNNWWGHSSGPGGVGPGSGDEVSTYVTYSPWLTSPVTGISEQDNKKVADWHFNASIICGPIQIPAGRKCVVYDISGRKINPLQAGPGVFFIEIDDAEVYKIIKVK